MPSAAPLPSSFIYNVPPETAVLPREELLATINTQDPKIFQSYFFDVHGYTIQNTPYIVKFMNKEDAQSHFLNSQIFRYVGLPIHSYLPFDFSSEDLSGLGSIRNNTVYASHGVYAPIITGDALGNEHGCNYATIVHGSDMMRDNIAGICTARYIDILGKNIFCTDKNEVLLIDPEKGVFNDMYASKGVSAKHIIHPDFGDVTYILGDDDKENTDALYQRIVNRFHLKSQQAAVDKSAVCGAAHLVEKLQKESPAFLDQFAEVKARMMGFALYTYHKAGHHAAIPV